MKSKLAEGRCRWLDTAINEEVTEMIEVPSTEHGKQGEKGGEIGYAARTEEIECG